MEAEEKAGHSLAVSDPVADAELLLKLVDTLKGVPANDRGRYVRAAMLFLGTPLDGHEHSAANTPNSVSSSGPDANLQTTDLPRRVLVWMSQNTLDEKYLEGVFHFGPSGAELIAHTVPGRSNREKVRGCYLLAGIQALLRTGDGRFSDDSARAICRDLGCYDKANHSTYIKSLGNLVVGSKSSSFELTQPGLKAAAELIRELRGAVA